MKWEQGKDGYAVRTNLIDRFVIVGLLLIVGFIGFKIWSIFFEGGIRRDERRKISAETERVVAERDAIRNEKADNLKQTFEKRNEELQNINDLKEKARRIRDSYDRH